MMYVGSSNHDQEFQGHENPNQYFEGYACGCPGAYRKRRCIKERLFAPIIFAAIVASTIGLSNLTDRQIPLSTGSAQESGGNRGTVIATPLLRRRTITER